MTTVPALWLKHRPLARLIAREFYLPGSERQDVEQEALIALWEATRDYRPDGGANFRTFADIVIRRKLTDRLKAARRAKRAILNDSARDLDLARLPHLHQVTERVEELEEVRRLFATIARDLSPWERHCVVALASGLSYPEIGPVKAVDNALFRARAKLRAAA